MTDLQKLHEMFASMGVQHEIDMEGEGWGLPDYLRGEVDDPPPVKAINANGICFYFDKNTEAFLGTWNGEFSSFDQTIGREEGESCPLCGHDYKHHGWSVMNGMICPVEKD